MTFQLQRNIAPLTTLALMLVGGFSLTRIDVTYEDWGILAEARYWIGFVLILMMSGAIAVRPTVMAGWRVWGWVGLVVGLHGLVAVSALWSDSPPEDTREILDLALLALVLVLAVFIFATSPETGIHVLLKAAVLASVCLTLVGVLLTGQIVGDIPQLGAGGIGVARLHGVAIISAVYLWQKRQSRYWVIAIPTCLAGTMLSGSRAAVLSVGLTALLLVPVLVQTSKRGAVGLMVAVGVVCTLMVSTTTGERILEYFWSTLWLGGRADSPALDAIYYADRDRFWRETWELFQESPVWGAGYGSFAHTSDVAYPHNLLFSIAVDTGLIGLALIAIILMLLVRRWHHPRSVEHTFAAMVGFFYFVCATFAGNYYDARLMWLFLLLYMLPTSPGRAGLGAWTTAAVAKRLTQRHAPRLV